MHSSMTTHYQICNDKALIWYLLSFRQAHCVLKNEFTWTFFSNTWNIKINLPQFSFMKSLCNTVKEISNFAPIQQGTEKTWSCFALDTEHQYCAVTVQYLCRVKKISMTSNVLPLHFAPKGQLISKCLLVETMTPKRHFEINWP